jgi:hypothetical protein
MFSIVSIIVLVFFHFIKVSSECESDATLWIYYPCSFIISSTSFYCQYVSIKSSIDQCINKEMTFFWHYPLGNMTLTLQSDNNQPFLLHLSKMSLSTNKLIKNVYHLVDNKIAEEQLIYNNKDEMITLYSDKYNQCSIRFETINSKIFDYGTFISMTILTDESKIR